MALTEMQHRRLAERGLDPRFIRLQRVLMAEPPPAFLTAAGYWAHPSSYVGQTEHWVDCPVVVDETGVSGVILPDGQLAYYRLD